MAKASRRQARRQPHPQRTPDSPTDSVQPAARRQTLGRSARSAASKRRRIRFADQQSGKRMRRRSTPRILVDFGQLGNEASQGGLPEPDLKWSVFFPKEPEPGLFRTEKALASDAAPTPAPRYGKAPKCTYFRVRGGGATRRRRARFPDCERGVGRPGDAAFAPLTVVREASVASSKKGKGRRSKERRVEFGGIRRDSG